MPCGSEKTKFAERKVDGILGRLDNWDRLSAATETKTKNKGSKEKGKQDNSINVYIYLT